MSYGDEIINLVGMEKDPMANATIVVSDLGPGNVGPLGPPVGTDPTVATALAEQPCAEAYRLPADDCFMCMDGRLTEAEEAQIELPGLPETAPAQVAGSLPVSESNASYMADPATHQPRSKVLAKKTRGAVDDGIKVKVHGSKQAGKGGCAALAESRSALRFNAENVDIVGPQVWDACKQHSLNDHITEADVNDSIMNGKEAADDEALWDVTPEQAIDIMVANGAEYEEVVGEHEELTWRVDNTKNGAFAKVAYARDKRAAGEPEQALSVSLGKLKSVVFERAARHGRTEREAALETMRIFTFNLGLIKMLMNEQAKAGHINEAK